MITVVVKTNCVVNDTEYFPGQIANVDDNFPARYIKRVIATAKDNELQRRSKIEKLKQIKEETNGSAK
jgi:hypothetical protein